MDLLQSTDWLWTLHPPVSTAVCWGFRSTTITSHKELFKGYFPRCSLSKWSKETLTRKGTLVEHKWFSDGCCLKRLYWIYKLQSNLVSNHGPVLFCPGLSEWVTWALASKVCIREQWESLLNEIAFARVMEQYFSLPRKWADVHPEKANHVPTLGQHLWCPH